MKQWMPAALFLATLGLLIAIVRPARGDDGLLAKIAALEARNAGLADQDKHDTAGDPFAPKNTTRQKAGCTCPYCTCNPHSNCGEPGCPKAGGSARPANEYPIPYPNDPSISAAEAAGLPWAPSTCIDNLPDYRGGDPFIPSNATRPTAAARVAKSCPCSPACTCGCNDGQPCRCGSAPSYSVPFRSIPAYSPAPAFPAFGGFGGGRCSGGG